jgi:hypothetical protein
LGDGAKLSFVQLEFGVGGRMDHLDDVAIVRQSSAQSFGRLKILG